MTRSRQYRSPRIRGASLHARRRTLLLDVLEDRCLLAGSITEYGGLTSGSAPVSIVAGPAGDLWFTEPGSNKIGRMTTSGSLTEYAIPTRNSLAATITAGPDGKLWFTEPGSNKIGRVTTSGSFTEFAIPTRNSLAATITAGPDGKLWFTEPGSNKIGRVTTSGSFTEYTVPTAGSLAAGIAPGPDGDLWFTEPGSNKIARATSGLTTTSLSTSITPSVFGQAVTLTATVTANTPEPNSPGGTVTFRDGSNVLGTGTLNSSGLAMLTVSDLSVGAHTITAAYAGDSNFVNSTSAPLSQQVGQDRTATTLGVDINPSFYDQAVMFTATVGVEAPGAGAPTGEVDFYDSATRVGSGMLQLVGSQYQAGSVVATLSVGTHSITAVYLGDGNDQGSASAELSQAIRPIVVTIQSPAANALTNQSITVSGQTAGLSALQGQIDAGPEFALPLDGSGAFGTTVDLVALGLIDGAHVIHLTATDLGGQPAGPYDAAFTLDTQPPTIAVSSPAANAYTKSVTVAGLVTDNLSGVSSLRAKVDGGTFTAVSFDGQGHFSFNTNLAMDGSADGPHTAYLQATDGAGNVSGVLAVPFTLDTHPPTVAVSSPAANAYTNSVIVAGSVADDRSGVAGLQGEVDGGTFSAVSFDAQGDFRFNTGLAVGGAADGPHTAYLRATDGAGNVSALFTLPFILKTRPPAVPTFDLAAGTADLGPESTSAARVTLVGHTDPGVTLALLGTTLTAASTSTGAFQFPDVSLAPGDNALTIAATDVAGNTSQYPLTIHRGSATDGVNQVIYWNQVQLQAIVNDATTPEAASRGLAMVSAAVYDAVNAIDGTPGYYVALTAPAGASADAAAASAAYTVLCDLFPAQVTNFNSLLAADMANLPTGQSLTDGMAVGQSVANAIIAMRTNDGSTNYVDYTPGTAPGDWQPTAPAFMPAENPQWATLKPFAMTSDSQFRPGAPPDLTSQQYANDVNKTLDLGSVNSTTRTADETQIAKFWNDGAGTYTPPGHWNSIAEQVAQQQGDSLAQDARLFAELNVALGDAAIVAWDAKFADNTWRPIQLAGGAGMTVNGPIETIANWEPLINTPPFPEYISGHSTFSSAAAGILTAAFGDNYSFTTGSMGLPGVARSYTSFEQAAEEAGESRIYGGIHFEFSNQAALTAGSDLAAYILRTFSTSTDQTPPTIALTSPSTGSVTTNANITITGRVLDNLSGVATLEVQIDGGALAPVAFDAQGNFSLTTAFATDGSADGAHTIGFEATDVAGNATPVLNVAMTLDTQAPAIALSNAMAGDEMTAGTLLAGTVDGTGSPITSLVYEWDYGMTIPIALGPDGSFSQELNLSGLALGGHTLTVTARDSAGNVAQDSVTVNLAAPPALSLSSVAPTAGAVDVGVTFRPKIVFSRPIDTTTLTASDFYLTDSTGAVIATTIVPSSDGTYAWLFPTNPMPGGSTITLTVDGSQIKASDGTPLDAAGNGTAGSVLTETFTTVSTANLPNTSLSGIVADPGPDLKPGTFDDVRSGPDGVLMTGDDIYLLPIAGVTVSILGDPQDTTVTGPDGSFSFSSVPTGDVKLVIEGTTATSPPAGYYFPEMVLDLTLQPGIANTVMGSMGSREEEAANATDRGVYLPRVHTSILQPVSNTQPTTINVPAEAAPDLTSQQRQYLSLQVQPNSAIGADGQVLENVQIGVSTVPTSLIKDMLPAGVQQPPVTITVQAPGVATFTTPVAVSYPNVFGAAPGTKELFISFDHTTGRLEIEGTATVSADGLSVVTDPGRRSDTPRLAFRRQRDARWGHRGLFQVCGYVEDGF